MRIMQGEQCQEQRVSKESQGRYNFFHFPECCTLSYIFDPCPIYNRVIGIKIGTLKSWLLCFLLQLLLEFYLFFLEICFRGQAYGIEQQLENLNCSTICLPHLEKVLSFLCLHFLISMVKCSKSISSSVQHPDPLVKIKSCAFPKICHSSLSRTTGLQNPMYSTTSQDEFVEIQFLCFLSSYFKQCFPNVSRNI